MIVNTAFFCYNTLKGSEAMFNFFAKENADLDGRFYISGSDHNHIKNVLRMKSGDEFLVSFGGESHLCVLESLDEDTAVAKITHKSFQSTELPVYIHLFQGLPKADKMELIIQKCTELGVSEITPVEMRNCVVKLEEKKKKSKTERWQAIAESAAKQSKRNLIPMVNTPLSFAAVMEMADEFDLFLVPYESEDGMNSTKNALSKIKSGSKIAVLIGPEGGFDEIEIEKCKDKGLNIVSLGKRILRTETAAITSVGMCMLYSELSENL